MYVGSTCARSRRNVMVVVSRPGSATQAQPMTVPSNPAVSTATATPSRTPSIALSAVSISPSSMR